MAHGTERDTVAHGTEGNTVAYRTEGSTQAQGTGCKQFVCMLLAIEGETHAQLMDGGRGGTCRQAGRQGGAATA